MNGRLTRDRGSLPGGNPTKTGAQPASYQVGTEGTDTGTKGAVDFVILFMRFQYRLRGRGTPSPSPHKKQDLVGASCQVQSSSRTQAVTSL